MKTKKEILKKYTGKGGPTSERTPNLVNPNSPASKMNPGGTFDPIYNPKPNTGFDPIGLIKPQPNPVFGLGSPDPIDRKTINPITQPYISDPGQTKQPILKKSQPVDSLFMSPISKPTLPPGWKQPGFPQPVGGYPSQPITTTIKQPAPPTLGSFTDVNKRFPANTIEAQQKINMIKSKLSNGKKQKIANNLPTMGAINQ